MHLQRYSFSSYVICSLDLHCFRSWCALTAWVPCVRLPWESGWVQAPSISSRRVAFILLSKPTRREHAKPRRMPRRCCDHAFGILQTSTGIGLPGVLMWSLNDMKQSDMGDEQRKVFQAELFISFSGHMR